LLTKFIKFTLLVLDICVLSAAPVFADTTHTFTFTSTPGPLMHSETFTSTQLGRSGPLSLTAAAWALTSHSNNLFAKNGGPGNTGLGLVGGIEKEISNLPAAVAAGTVSFVQLNIGAMLAAAAAKGLDIESVTLGIDSLNPPERYTVRGSNGVGAIGNINYGSFGPTAGVSGTFAVPISGSTARPFINVSAHANGESVLLESVTVTTTSVTTTPELSSAGLLLIGLGALVAAGTLGKKLIA
jgi:hypothetical protein